MATGHGIFKNLQGMGQQTMKRPSGARINPMYRARLTELVRKGEQAERDEQDGGSSATDRRIAALADSIARLTAHIGAAPAMAGYSQERGEVAGGHGGSLEYGGNFRFDAEIVADDAAAQTVYDITLSGDNELRAQGQKLVRIGCYIQPVAGVGGQWGVTPESAIVTLMINGVPQKELFREPLRAFVDTLTGEQRSVRVDRQLPGQTVDIALRVEVIDAMPGTPGQSSRLLFWGEAGGARA